MLERLCLPAGLGNAPETPLEELDEVTGNREVWASLLHLPPATGFAKGNEWMNGVQNYVNGNNPSDASTVT